MFGSGGARSTPPGFDHHLVPGQLQDFLLLAGGIAADHDMDLVIEPLWRDVCDTINTIVEGYVAARQSGHPRVWTLADWFHVFHNDEPLETVAEVAPRLRHIHVPVPPIPGAPEQPTDPGFDNFLDALLATGYDLRMSVEDNGKRFTDFATQAGPALDYLRARVPGVMTSAESPAYDFDGFIDGLDEAREPSLAFHPGTDFEAWRAALLERVESLLGDLPTLTEAEPRILESTDRGAYVQHKLVYETVADVWVPAWLLMPRQRFGGPARLGNPGAARPRGRQRPVGGSR